MTFFLGIDGGGSKTTAAVGDELKLLASATAGPCNMTRVPEAEARASLHAAIREASAAAGVSPERIAGVCLGLAGAASPIVSAAARRFVAEVVPGEIEIAGDMVIALESAFAGGPGVIVIAGTGSIAFGRNPAGQTARAGGWGYAISDEGSGYWIGRAAVAAAARAQDRGQSSQLAAAITRRWRVASLEEAVRLANGSPPPDFSELFPVVLEVAGVGDALAENILYSAGRELAELAATVLGRLWPAGEAPVALCGGVFRHSSQVREKFMKTLRQLCPAAALSQEIAEPVQGALWLARRAAARLSQARCQSGS